VNFYKHHIGDYAQATGHLSFVEDAAYSRMIRKYYAEEKPLPIEVKAIQRLVGARTKEEKQAVEDVLQEFFTLESDGWRNKRCDAEIERANAQAETNRRIAEEREARKRERINQEAETKRRLFEHESSNASLHESSASREPSQTPDTRHQTPELTAHASTDSTTPSPGGLASARMRQAGLADANPSHPKLLALLAEGITLDELGQAAGEAVQKKKGFAYALAVAEGRRRDAATAPLPMGSPSGGKQGLRADYLRQQGYTGGENGDSSGERIIDGQAERVA